MKRDSTQGAPPRTQYKNTKKKVRNVLHHPKRPSQNTETADSRRMRERAKTKTELQKSPERKHATKGGQVKGISHIEMMPGIITKKARSTEHGLAHDLSQRCGRDVGGGGRRRRKKEAGEREGPKERRRAIKENKHEIRTTKKLRATKIKRNETSGGKESGRIVETPS